MEENKCPQCGAPLDPGAGECRFCGEKIVVRQTVQQGQPQTAYQQGQPLVIIQQVAQQPVYTTGINPAWPIKSKVAATLLGIFLGGIGAHKFYMGKIGMGIVYLLFCWTGVPAIIGFIEGIVYLCSNDENFQLKNQVRVG